MAHLGRKANGKLQILRKFQVFWNHDIWAVAFQYLNNRFKLCLVYHAKPTIVIRCLNSQPATLLDLAQVKFHVETPDVYFQAFDTVVRNPRRNLQAKFVEISISFTVAHLEVQFLDPSHIRHNPSLSLNNPILPNKFRLPSTYRRQELSTERANSYFCRVRMPTTSLISAFAGSRNNTFFDQLVEKYHAKLTAFARSLGSTQDESEDIVQNVWLCLYERPPKLSADHDKADTSYLYQSVRDKWKMLVRSEVARRKRELTFEQGRVRREFGIVSAVESLPSTLRDVVRYVFYDQLTLRDAASKLGVTYYRVQSLLRDAMQHLHVEMA